jgi:parallel beta-helix repeat protein
MMRVRSISVFWEDAMTSSWMRLRAPRCSLVAAIVAALFAVTAAPAYASHVACGSLITTDTTLDSNVGPCIGDALIVAADGVTLDLGGHTVSGAGTGAGVRVARHTGVEVMNGTSEGFDTGLVLDEADRHHIWSLILRDNLRQGITVAGSDANVIEKNSILDNDGDAIRLGLSDGNVVRKNVAVGNVFGIGVADGSDGNLVEKNSVSATDVFGIAVFSNSTNNRVEKNDVVGTLLGDGIIVASDSSGTRITKNVASGNADDGIDVENQTTTVTANTANGNADLGIEAVPGTRDGGGNRASGNGNPAQCTGVTCSS